MAQENNKWGTDVRFELSIYNKNENVLKSGLQNK